MSPKKRKEVILAKLKELGGKASTREIAIALDINVNGVAQTLGAMYMDVLYVSGKGGDSMWKVVEKERTPTKEEFEAFLEQTKRVFTEAFMLDHPEAFTDNPYSH